MRVLIVSAAILACATCAPSGLAIAPAPLAFAPPTPILTVNSGDIAAASIDAHVAAQDHARASLDAHSELNEQVFNSQNDAARELTDQAREITEERFWNAEDQKWQAYDAIKTVESKIDGASAEVSPVLAKSLVSPLAPVAYAAAPVPVAAPWAYAASAPIIAQPYSVIKPETKTIVTQSLSQTHPSPAILSPVSPIVEAAIVEAPIAKASLIEAPVINTIVSPAKQTISTQSLSQTHPAPLVNYVAPQPLIKTFGVAELSASSLIQNHGYPAARIGYSSPYLPAPLYNAW